MEWQHPQWLYLILPLGVAWLALALYSRRRRRRAAAAFVAQAMWPRILPADSRAGFWVKTLLRETALVTGLVALAGPRFGTQYEDVIPRGSDLYVLIDVSRSMLAEDVPPSRLGRAKADVAALVNRLEGERVGLIAFAGQAVVKCPLTVDYDAFRRSLDELDPNSAPRGGTAIGDAIRKALEVFQARANRDQAILLITDGDDQQSYPREAAAVAAERQVTIFTVGLGDADHGARIPKGAAAQPYVEYQGQQVWSKLNDSLLREIALKTSGVYVPVGTRAYDLGELYAKYLQGRRGGDEESTRRIRRADQFQIFLALALLALLADALTPAYPRLVKSQDQGPERRPGAPVGSGARAPHPAQTIATALALLASLAGASRAESPASAVREGLRQYGKGEFDKARESFALAREQFDRSDPARAAVAAFDQACAAHRKGDLAQARQWYLKAGLAHDKQLAASAHFNLGTLAAEEARRLAGDHPESLPADQRPAILDQLKAAVASFRHCLELQPQSAQARRNIELVRQWVKYYSDKWSAYDREQRRRETDLVAFLEFLIETERALRESVKALTATAPADAFAELKRLQDELLQEIAPLKEKINAELRPQRPAAGGAAQGSPGDLEQGIALLLGWANTAGDKMISAARHLDGRQAAAAAAEQQSAIDELEKIWEAVIPFRALLARALADQTLVARALQPAPAGGSTDAAEQPAPAAPSPGTPPPSLGTEQEDLAPLLQLEERTARRTRLLKLKAEAERTRLEQAPPERGAAAPRPPSGNDPGAAAPKPIDPEQLKAGYQRAIELAPRAVEQMEHALEALRKKDRPAAYPPAEEARKILEEIQNAQPRNDEPKEQDKKKEDQPKPDRQDQPKQEQPKQEQPKDDRQKQDQQKKEAVPKKQEQAQPEPQVSPDQVEAALRRVRERQQEKRERDRMMKARMFGRVPVEKDW
jgi:Ca-activated chloride channel family protein